ncbi:hypothetical protein K1719_008028 [Acacia pycnantha]|nr:hypothetical protein K1719_008028 [Acacia pycnantha]
MSSEGLRPRFIAFNEKCMIGLMRSDCLFKTTSMVVGSSSSGRISHAHKWFDEMPHRDSVAWNAMISGYSQLGLYHEALSLFSDMRVSHCRPDSFSFSATLSTCTGACQLQPGTRVHALVVVSGYLCYPPMRNPLVDRYGKCSSPHDARKVFDEMSCRNEVTWCSLLSAYVNSGYTRNGNGEQALHMLVDMVRDSSIQLDDLLAGPQTHNYLLENQHSTTRSGPLPPRKIKEIALWQWIIIVTPSLFIVLGAIDVLYNGNQIMEINAFGDPNCAVDITRQR